MATNDDRKLPTITGGKDDPADRRSVQEAIRQIYEIAAQLEGRLTTISLRNDLSVDGDVSATGDLSTEGSITLDNFIEWNERTFDSSGQLTPAISSAGTSRIYMNPTDGKLKVSQDGGAYTDLVVSAVPTGTTPMCRVYNSANISIPNATATDLTFDSERFDTDSMHSTVSNTNRITFNKAGKYLVGCNVVWDAGAGVTRQVRIMLNGTTRIAYDLQDVSVANNHAHVLCTFYEFAVGDYITCSVYQGSGGALNVLGGVGIANASPEFWAVLVPSTYLT